MIAIKDIEMPKGCQHCRYFQKHLFGIGLDYSYSCVFGATEFPYPWIRQMEERASDCPLVEIEERKVGKWIRKPVRYDKGGVIGPEMICSCCNKDNKHDEYMDYCPNCGAEMVGIEK